MNPFFATEERRRALEAEARRWLGTPFVPHAARCRAGVDCVHLNAAIYMALGHLPFFRPPAYTLDGGRHNSNSALLTWLEAHGTFFERVHCTPSSVHFADLVQPGDTLCFRSARSAHHAALMVTERKFIHAHERYGVIEGDFNDRVYRLGLTAVYRPIKL